jgi:TolB-like protein/Tfp pilus assembly protein PilF
VDAWPRIKEIFAECHELPAAERAAALARACEAEPHLHSEVAALIASYEAAGNFLELPAAIPPSRVAPGMQLGPYEVLECIGVGGMGEVYRARDTRLDRIVALKTLTWTAADEAAKRRFEHEARIVSRLNHPNICALFDIGRHDGVEYLVMEFLEGETLSRRLERGPLPREELLRHAVAIADALDRAHRQGVVHHDLKPSNIVLTESGAKLLDFGIASLQGADVEASGVFGTIAYMSPEQLSGATGDAQSDLFSFGAVLYEMATGRRAFCGDRTEDVSRAIRKGVTSAFVDAAAQVDKRVVPVIGKALAPNRNERYRSAAEIRDDLQRIQSGSAAAGWWPAAAAAFVILAIVAAVVLSQWRESGKPASSVRAVAVLPFKPLVPGGSDDYVGVALADALISELGVLETVSVRPLSTISRYARQAADPVEAGRALNVQLVVDGAIQRSGERLRVSVHLIRVGDGSTVWSDRFDARWTDVFRVQDAIAEQVAHALAVQLTGEHRRTVQRRRPANLQAYEAYLKGRYFWNNRTAGDVQRALRYFGDAIGRDPEYASAYAGLADTFALLGSTALAVQPPGDAGKKAIAAAARALELDDSLAEAHVSYAFAVYSFDWEWSRGEQHFQRAIALDADYATAHYWYSLFLNQVGRVDEALAAAERAVALEPLSPVGTYAVGLAHYCARRFDRAREYAQRVLEVDPTYPLGLRLLGSSLAAEGRYQDAIPLYEQLVESAPANSLYAAWLAHVYGRAGREAEARQILRRFAEQAAAGEYVAAANLAIGHLGVGDTDAALDSLEHALAERSQALTYLKIDPVYDPLRSDPRFVNLLVSVGLTR